MFGLSTPAHKATAQQRYPWVDYAKGIAIILVVYRHMLGGYERMGIEIAEYYSVAQQSVYNFRMPLFFLLSGIFIRKSLIKRTTSEFVNYKANTIMYPYVVWATLQLAIQILFSRYTNGEKDLYSFAYILYAPRELDQFWFLYTIFNITIIYALTYRYARINATGQLVLAMVFYYLSTLPTVQSVGLLHDTLQYYLYFALGSWFARFILDEKKSTRLFSVTTFVVLAIVFLVSQWYWIQNPSLRLEQPFVFAVIAIIGSIFIINLSFLLGQAQVLKPLKTVGRHSLYIYIMHVILLGLARALLVNILGLTEAVPLMLLSMVVATVGPILVYQFCVNNRMWMLFSFRRPKAVRLS
jgi:fucose 4-O-acetylase-like acetyltransferase